MSNLVQVAVGTRMDSPYVQRFKATTTPTQVVAFLDKNPHCVETHYLEKKYYFFCFKGSCCTKMGIPSQRYVFPVLRYSPGPNNSYGPPGIAVEFLSVSAAYYEQLCLQEDLEKDALLNYDYFVTCSDAEMQKIAFVKGPASLWRQTPGLVAQVTEQLPLYYARIEMSLARTKTEAEFLADYNQTAMSSAPANQGRPAPANTWGAYTAPTTLPPGVSTQPPGLLGQAAPGQPVQPPVYAAPPAAPPPPPLEQEVDEGDIPF